MKSKSFKLIMIALVAITSFSCSSSDDDNSSSLNTGIFTATIGTESFSTNDTFLAEVSAGGTQAFIATGTNGKSFSSAIFPSQFPIGEAKNIAYSSSITYKVGDVTYIPISGTMTMLVMENYKRMKGNFTGVFVGGNPSTEIEISGEFDISNP